MTEQGIPPPPEKPTPMECCGSGCVPCIFDYYEDQLEAWETKYQCTLAEFQQENRPKEQQQK